MRLEERFMGLKLPSPKPISLRLRWAVNTIVSQISQDRWGTGVVGELGAKKMNVFSIFSIQYLMCHFKTFFLWLSVKIAIIMTMIVGAVGDKTQPITLILHPDIVDDILRLTFQCILMKKQINGLLLIFYFESTQGLTTMTQDAVRWNWQKSFEPAAATPYTIWEGRLDFAR